MCIMMTFGPCGKTDLPLFATDHGLRADPAHPAKAGSFVWEMVCIFGMTTESYWYAISVGLKPDQKPYTPPRSNTRYFSLSTTLISHFNSFAPPTYYIGGSVILYREKNALYEKK